MFLQQYVMPRDIIIYMVHVDIVDLELHDVITSQVLDDLETLK